MAIGAGWADGAWIDAGWAANAWSDEASATLSGTVFGAAEADIVAGGRTIVITLTGATWRTQPSFDIVRAAIIGGLESAQSEATGWNAEVRAKEVVEAVVRTSDTVVTVTLSPAPAYNITAAETITVTVNAVAISVPSFLTATPTFDITVAVDSAALEWTLGAQRAHYELEGRTHFELPSDGH